MDEAADDPGLDEPEQNSDQEEVSGREGAAETWSFWWWCECVVFRVVWKLTVWQTEGFDVAKVTVLRVVTRLFCGYLID